MTGSWNAATPGPGEASARSQLAAPSVPGARSIFGASLWKRSTAACLKETTISLRCFVRRSSRASTLAFFTYSSVASSGVRPLISTLMGVCGKAFSTSASLGTRKSRALKPFGAAFRPVATPRKR